MTFNNHKRTAHQHGNSKFVCEECGHNFATKQGWIYFANYHYPKYCNSINTIARARRPVLNIVFIHFGNGRFVVFPLCSKLVNNYYAKVPFTSRVF